MIHTWLLSPVSALASAPSAMRENDAHHHFVDLIEGQDLEGSGLDITYIIKFKILEATSGGIDLLLIWIPIHRNIFGNKMTDTLAKLGALSSKQPPEQFCSILEVDFIARKKN
ncbi:hypothetical protein EAI_01215 [Harpegnathos saltator]|uniref:Uncharacterized protein n=1 Tax=Harpegnathos saltator TaxID=610380 RepID=E2C933_HARSA|nr:hypothetical protein EAI_01215 [Harpegnathos saltator]